MPTRPLAEHERELLLHLVSAAPASADALRTQVSHALVVGDDQAPSISLGVPPTTPRAQVADGPLPINAYVYDGAEYLGELLVWVRDGYLDAVEYAWVTDDPPTVLPDRSAVRTTSHG